MLEGSKGLIAKNFENKQKEKNIDNMNRNMKSVDTYGNGTTGYRIKNGVNAGKVGWSYSKSKVRNLKFCLPSES
jgi:hypothetical protein